MTPLATSPRALVAQAWREHKWALTRLPTITPWQLLPADVLCFQYEHLIGELISIWIGPHSHAALVLEPGVIVDSSERGVARLSLERLLSYKKRIGIWSLPANSPQGPLTSADVQGILDFVVEHMGHPFPVHHLFYLAWLIATGRRQTAIIKSPLVTCSALVAGAYMNAPGERRIDIVPGHHWSVEDPHQFTTSGVLKQRAWLDTADLPKYSARFMDNRNRFDGVRLSILSNEISWRRRIDLFGRGM